MIICICIGSFILNKVERVQFYTCFYLYKIVSNTLFYINNWFKFIISIVIKMSELIENKRETQMNAVQQEAFKLFMKKNADYGDAFANYWTFVLIVRMGDKIQRLQNITKSGVHFVEN